MSMASLYQNDKVTSRNFFTFLDIYLPDKKQQHSAMKTIQEIRRENARYLAKSAGSDVAFADKVGISPSRVSQLIGVNPIKNIGHTTARRIEAAFQKRTGWLDAQQEFIQQEVKDLPRTAIQAPSVGEQNLSSRQDYVNANDMKEFIDAYTSVNSELRRLMMESIRAIRGGGAIERLGVARNDF